MHKKGWTSLCSSRQLWSTGPRLMTDTQHSTLNTPCIWLGIPERRMWILLHFKIPHSSTWIWCWSFKGRVLINHHKFRAWTQNLWWILRTLHSGFTLHTQDSPIQIHWVLSVECWVSVISLGPGVICLLSTELDIYRILHFHSLWQVSLVKQGTLTRPGHPFPPPRHNILMFDRSTCYEIYVYTYMYVCTCMLVYRHIHHVYMCIYMYMDVRLWIYVYTCISYSILYLLIGSVLWIVTLNSGWWFDRTGIYFDTFLKIGYVYLLILLALRIWKINLKSEKQMSDT